VTQGQVDWFWHKAAKEERGIRLSIGLIVQKGFDG